MQDGNDQKNPLFNEIWPQERDIISRPDRIRYIRQLKAADSTCVFCDIIKKNIFSPETLLLYKSKHSVVIMNKFPYNPAHLLVLPLTHIGDLEQMDVETLTDIGLNLQKCVKILKAEYNCQGLNLGVNHGHVAGAGIPEHLHWHVIPRWIGDTNFFPIIAETKVHPETIADTYNRLKPHFDKEIQV